MSKRKYTNMKVLLPQIQAMLSEGKSHREIEEHFGLIGERPVHHLLKQERRRQAKLKSGIPPKSKGRPRSRPLTETEEYKREISRLQMENKLLRDFLQSTERM